MKRAKACQHKRRTKHGRIIIVNKGVHKRVKKKMIHKMFDWNTPDNKGITNRQRLSAHQYDEFTPLVKNIKQAGFTEKDAQKTAEDVIVGGFNNRIGKKNYGMWPLTSDEQNIKDMNESVRGLPSHEVIKKLHPEIDGMIDRERAEAQASVGRKLPRGWSYVKE